MQSFFGYFLVSEFFNRVENQIPHAGLAKGSTR